MHADWLALIKLINNVHFHKLKIVQGFKLSDVIFAVFRQADNIQVKIADLGLAVWKNNHANEGIQARPVSKKCFHHKYTLNYGKKG